MAPLPGEITSVALVLPLRLLLAPTTCYLFIKPKAETLNPEP